MAGGGSAVSLAVDIRARVGTFTFEGAVRAEPGELLAVLGPNGAGKSTLLGAIAGHLDDVTGTIRLNGSDLQSADGRRVPPEQRRVGLLGQRSLLFPHLSIRENVAFGPRSQGLGRADARDRASRLLDEVGLAGFEDRRPSQLSGGQQQRAAIARALAADPHALLLDEPFAALDAQTAAQARRLIADLRDRTGIPMVLVTHDALDAVVLATRTMVLQDGRIAQEGTTQEVLGHPGSSFVAALAGVNLVSGLADSEGRLVFAGAGVEPIAFPRTNARASAAGMALSAAFAPGAVRVRRVVDGADATGGGDGAQLTGPAMGTSMAHWTGTVQSLEPTPGGVRIRTEQYPEIAVDCSSSTAVDVGVRPGTRLAFSLAADDVSVRPTG